MTEFDPHALIQKARKGSLSIGEAEALSIHISGLERALKNRSLAQAAAVESQFVKLMLDASGLNFVVIFPGEPEHFVPLPADNPPIAVKFLLDTLRKRKGKSSTIATQGAPTKEEVKALLATYKKPPKKAVATSLEDLGDFNFGDLE